MKRIIRALTSAVLALAVICGIVLNVFAAEVPEGNYYDVGGTLCVNMDISPRTRTTTDNIVTSLDLYKYIDKTTTVKTFTDVKPGSWYYKTVIQASTLGLINGYGNGKFGPSDTLTRSQWAQILYNRFGNGSKDTPNYSDVKTTAWYAPAVGWSQARGIVEGYSDGTFKPDQKITREEIVKALWNLEGKPLMPDQDTVLADFKDKDQVAADKLTAFAWGVKAGIIMGTSKTTLSPRSNADRAQAATFAIRLLTFDCEDIPYVDDYVASGDKNVDESTSADKVNAATKFESFKWNRYKSEYELSGKYSNAGKSNDYPTIGQADKPNANGYFTEANVDISGSELNYKALDYINTKYREGKTPYVWTSSDEMEEYALMRAKEAWTLYNTEYDKFDSENFHCRPDGSDNIAAENLYFGRTNGSTDYKNVVDAWWKSSGHKRLLTQKQSEIAVAVYKDCWVLVAVSDSGSDGFVLCANDNYYDTDNTILATKEFKKSYPYFAYVGHIKYHD